VLGKRPEWSVCAEASDGETAVRLAFEHMPDLAILDYSLARLNGTEAARQIRMAGPKTAVLMYTMHQQEIVVGYALGVGVHGYLLKGADETELVAAVEAIGNGQTYFSPAVEAFVQANRLASRPMVAMPALSPREREVIQLVAEGQTNRSIAERWGVSMKTVDTHRVSAMRKLNLHSAVDLARYAIRSLLIEP
jgi:DNA-binding NarL/FixJ family response regulator